MTPEVAAMATAIALALIKGFFDWLERSKRQSGRKRTRSGDHLDDGQQLVSDDEVTARRGEKW